MKDKTEKKIVMKKEKKIVKKKKIVKNNHNKTAEASLGIMQLYVEIIHPKKRYEGED